MLPIAVIMSQYRLGKDILINIKLNCLLFTGNLQKFVSIRLFLVAGNDMHNPDLRENNLIA